MKCSAHRNNILYLSTFVLLTGFMMLGMGGGGETSTTATPEYKQLADGQASYNATIVDGDVKTEVYNISLSKKSDSTGKTSITDVATERDNSYNVISFEHHKKFVVKEQNYNSKQYANQVHTLVSVADKNGVETEGLLFEPDTNISAIEKGSNTPKVWYLNKINKIIIHTHRNVAVTQEQPDRKPDEDDDQDDDDDDDDDMDEDDDDTLMEKAKKAGTAVVDVATDAGKAIVSAVQKTFGGSKNQ